MSGPGTSLARSLQKLASPRLPSPVTIALAVALMVFPQIVLRGFHFEEGLTAALAKGALTSGHWYVPDLFGITFIERPVLQSWIIAAIALPLGGVGQFVTRLPTVIAVYLCTWLVFVTLRSRVSPAAALFGASCFLFSPAILQKIIVAESDVLLTTAQFAAFCIWWRITERGGSSLPGWTAVGLLLAATALFKGPQPAAYFPLGVGAFIVVNRAWHQLPGFLLAGAISLSIVGIWYVAATRTNDAQLLLGYMRMAPVEMTFGAYLAERWHFLFSLLLQFIPATLVLIPAALAHARRKRVIATGDGVLASALLLYGGVALISLIFWPGARVRYAMPALPAAAVLAGLAFDGIAARNLFLTRATLTVLAALVSYQLAANWIVAPLTAFSSQNSRIASKIIDAAAEDRSLRFFAPLRYANNVLPYLDRPVSYLTPRQLGSIRAPAYLLAQEEDAAKITTERTDVRLVRLVAIAPDSAILFRVEGR